MSHPSQQLPKSSLVTGRLVKLSPKEIATISLILTSRQKRWETFIRQTLWGQDTSGVKKGSSDFILSILWMWQAIRLLQVSLLINRSPPCADIWWKHGDLWGFQLYPRWIMRWLLPVEGVIPKTFLKSSVFICFWDPSCIHPAKGTW